MTHLVVSLVDNSLSGIEGSAKAAFESGADLVEVRLDHFKGLTLRKAREIRHVVRGPAIATLRSAGEGGRSALGRRAREEMLTRASEAGFEYIDLELDRDASVLDHIRGEEWRPRIIASKHFLKPVSKSSIQNALRSALGHGDIAKVAMTCESASDAVMLAQTGLELSKRRKRFAIIGMGSQGQLTRVCARAIGSELAYASLPGREAAPGQMEARLQSDLLREGVVLLGLIGHPVSHSVSKPMHEAALVKAGLRGIYLPLDFPGSTFDRNALKVLRSLGFKGLNVTIPHKWKAFEMSNGKGGNAKATEAVNTLSFRGTMVYGENTDVNGFSRLLDGKITITRGLKSLMVGAGGAARAVAYVLSERDARLSVVDIDKRRARALARMFRARAVTWGQLWKERAEFDLIVNCSPVGMKGIPGNPLKPWLLGPGKSYVDIIFNPPATEAMKEAEGKGGVAIGGLEMLVQQGAESFRVWTGTEPDVEAMREAARSALG
ncbi:MAG: shikimate dehydrogenase [Candidatus Thermoplasmatota archaeon]|nr:shikimate dehydrogenase [Candidatus Thermoplasmatota archaeon]